MPFHMFLQDKSLWTPAATDAYSDASIDAGYAYMTDKVKSYFNTVKNIDDERVSRLSVSGHVSEYPMRFTYDSDTTDPDNPDDLDATELNQLFNITEALAYYTFMDDAAMEAELIGDNSAYGIYVPDSFDRSSTVATVDFYESDGAVADALDVHHKISFDISGSSFSATIVVWISKSDFLADYPHSTIVEVVYPGDPNLLVNGNYTSVVAAMTQATSYAFAMLNNPVSGKDNSGVVLFTSAYHPTGTTNFGDVSFAVIYKGPEPGTQALRDFIRTELLGMSIVAEEIWEDVLPDLFVNGKYYIVPAWDHTKALPNSIVLPQGIISTDRLIAIAKAVFPNIESMDPGWLEDHLETLVSAGSEYVLLAVPDYGNDPEFMSLLEEHPTYQPIDATKPFFQYQESHTQDFNESLSGALAVLTGATNLLSFTNDEINGLQYLTFIAGGKEYHVLKSESYPSVI